MKSVERERALEMRIKHKMGYGAIAKELRVAKSTLSRWLEDHPLSDDRILELRRESWGRGEAKREQFRKTMRAKRDARDELVYLKQKKKLSRISEQATYVAGLMLYAAEGDKKSRAEIAFANTDAEMVDFFAQWLTRFLHIPQTKLRAQLHLYEDMDLLKEEEYWRRALRMEKSQLVKSQVRPLRPGSFTYRESFRHGTCKLYVGGVAQKTELMLSIRAFFDTYKKHTQV